MTVDAFASQLAQVATQVHNGAQIDPEIFGAGGAGRLGELGRALADQWQAALDHATAEAMVIADDLSAACADLRIVAARYADAEHDAEHATKHATKHAATVALTQGNAHG